MGRSKDRNKLNASASLRQAVNLGKIKRMPCEVCGKENADGHHESYENPLVVKWLCRTHHVAEHSPISPETVKEIRAAYNGKHGESLKLARRFGLDPTVVNRIIRRKKYAWVA